MRAGGVGPQTTFQDRTVRFAPFTPEMYGQYESWLEMRVWQSVYRQESWMPPLKYRELERATRGDIGAERYAYGGEAFAGVSYTAPGLKQALLVSLREGEKGNTELGGLAGEKFVHDLFTQRQQECNSILIAIGWLNTPPKPEEDQEDADGETE